MPLQSLSEQIKNNSRTSAKLMKLTFRLAQSLHRCDRTHIFQLLKHRLQFSGLAACSFVSLEFMRTIRRSALLFVFLFGLVLVVTVLCPVVIGDVAGEEAQLLRLINQERASRSIATLSLHPLLFQVAKNYSREMMEHGFLSHISQVDGSMLWDRIRRSGYYDGYHGQIAVRENIALISGSARATSAHQNFMNSEGHQENLLASDVNEVGIGITEGTFQSIFSTIYVEVFAYHARDQQITLSANVNPITATVRSGEKASFTIHVESTVSTRVSIEVMNLNPPLAWNLAKPSGTTPFDTVLTVNTTSTPAGIYPFDITVKGGGQTKILSPTLNVISPTQTTTSRTTTAATSTSTSIASTTATTPTTITQISTATTKTAETSSSTGSTSILTTSETASITSTNLSEASSTQLQTATESTTHQATQTVSTSATSVATWRLPSIRCVIAAAYGLELSPEIQFLRQLRDGRVMSTFGGRMFMTAFNAAYYSFSPSVAVFVAERPWMALMVRVIIYPLISALRLTSIAFNGFPAGAEIGVLSFSLLASCLVGLIYVLPIAAIFDLRKASNE